MLCPADSRSRAARWLLSEHTLLEARGGVGALAGLFPEHTIELHTVHGTSWGGGALAGLFPGHTLQLPTVHDTSKFVFSTKLF